MPRFQVTVERTVTLTTTVEVDVANEDQARSAARQRLIEDAEGYADLSRWRESGYEEDQLLRGGEEELNRGVEVLGAEPAL